MKVSIVVAHSLNFVIGKDGDIPWSCPEDLKFFKDLTNRSPMIMGSKTFKSLPGVLPGRAHIILTRGENFAIGKGAERCYFTDHPLQALRMAKVKAKADNVNEIFIIGGEQIYTTMLRHVDTIYATIIRKNVDGDTFFPEYEQDFKIVDYVEGTKEAKDGTNYTFTKWERDCD